jgi:hypothetical protein
MTQEKQKTSINPAAASAALRGDFTNAAVAMTPGGIEAQEAAAQREFQQEQKLPKKGSMLPERGESETNRTRLEQLGVVFGKEIDTLFIAAQLPAGWEIRPTEHSLWSTLHDQGGRIRAKIFYKGAFYDRRAELHMRQRFHVVEWYAATPQESEEYSSEVQHCYLVTDHDGTALYQSDPYFSREDDSREQARSAAQCWIDERYPDYQNPFAYWDKN